MKKICLFILYLFALLFVWNFGQAYDYEYVNLDINADVKIDWSIGVTEWFYVNFFVNKHWIIREIPLNYSVYWQNFHIDVSDVYVQWKKFTTNRNNWDVEIIIWNEDETVVWKQIYLISYSTYWLIRSFSWMWYSELYWNLVWFDNDTNINSVRAEINLPKKVSLNSDDFLITVNWKENSVLDFGWDVDWSHWDKIVVSYDKVLHAWEWITLAIKFPRDYFIFDHDKQSALLWSLGVKNNNNSKFGSTSKSLFYLVGFFAFFFWMMILRVNILLLFSIFPLNEWILLRLGLCLIVESIPLIWLVYFISGLIISYWILVMKWILRIQKKYSMLLLQKIVICQILILFMKESCLIIFLKIKNQGLLTIILIWLEFYH